MDYEGSARPLYECTRKNVPFIWTSDCIKSFLCIKEAVASAPLLVHFQPDRPCVVETDASDFAIGLVLSQPQQNGVLHPVAFHSRKLSPAEVNYEAHDKELLAVVEAFVRWRHYLEGNPHTIRAITDHQNLKNFASSKY